MKKVAVIIVMYNAAEYIPGCFGSLEELDYPKDKLEIIAVDNSSDDNSAEIVKRNYPEVRLIESEKNLGFAGGNNLGIKKALEDGTDHVVLLNQDTEVEPDWLSELVKAAEGDGVGAVQSLLVLYDDKDRVQTSGNHIHFLGFGYSGDYRLPLADLKPKKEIAYPSGAAVLFTARALEEVGLLDEDFFMYHEDLDLGWRLRLFGYRIILAEKSVAYHKYSFSRNKGKYYFMERNRLAVLLKNCRWATILLVLPAFVLMEAGMLAFSFASGWGPGKLKSYGWVAKNFFSIMGKRRAVQAKRKAGDRQAMAYFSGKVVFEGLGNPLLKYVANPLFSAYWSMIKRLIFW